MSENQRIYLFVKYDY